ncbi:DUF397 domain-containing protein [Kineosporia rhizophila]|uniref:DUF397 domain-containing protein n=1 Tax=Kineosporia TaxID=49184 RepID=UPI000A53B4A4|nr:MULTISPECIES: DUF397 domain-containing protein [Kineosporia]MCE0534802.1 DUF397 domain-containing protein [Kineosporia rhizophila]GLY19269.1 hypothetical protein Kisp01_62830 [Kineosporia sp. NBRC 101677]
MLDATDATNGKPTPSPWRRAMACTSASCVEVKFVGEGVQVRDSKDIPGPILSFTKDEWNTFVAGVKNSEFEA